MFTLEQIAMIVPIVGGIIAITYYTLKIYDRLRKPPPEFILQRFKESVEKPVKSNWSIRIWRPNKPIEKCIVLYNGVRLPWWDNTDAPYYERFIITMGGGNVRMPIEIENEDAEVKIMDGKKNFKAYKVQGHHNYQPISGQNRIEL